MITGMITNTEGMMSANQCMMGVITPVITPMIVIFHSDSMITYHSVIDLTSKKI